MRPRYNFLPAMATAMLLLAGCQWEPLPPPETPPAKRVLLMYDNIDSDAGGYFTRNVNAAGKAVAAGALDPTERVIVFHRGYRVDEQTGSRSVVYELVKDASQTGGFRREMLKTYESGVNAALSTEVMAAVVRDIRTAIPADHYGFAFGSHGMGWIPKSNTVSYSRVGGQSGAPSKHPFAELWEMPENPRTRFFAGYNQKLDVSEFMDGLDGEPGAPWNWDFILLDDCFMAAVETMYEMRTLADYFIASPTEIMIEGFPYDRVVETIFADWTETGFKEVGREFVDYYRSKTGNYASATVAVVKTSELENLAETVMRLNLRLNELDAVDGIQFYEGITRPAHIFYDLDGYLSRIRASAAPTEYNAFKTQLERTVVFKDHTERFYSDFPRNFGTVVPVNSYSGLAVFIPWHNTSSFIPDYQKTEWYRYVYGE